MPKDTFFNLSADKQEKVMRAAIKEFLESGFENGNVGTIAKEAEVAKGSMYQYFHNKKELFLYSVRWATELLVKGFGIGPGGAKEEIDIFGYIYNSWSEILAQLKEEREVVTFLQDVFLGRYKKLTGESMAQMMVNTEAYVLNLIRNGKRKGYIRNDVDDHLIYIFMTGASMKFKEYLLNKAKTDGDDIFDKGLEAHDKEIKDLISLLRNGMGVK